MYIQRKILAKFEDLIKKSRERWTRRGNIISLITKSGYLDAPDGHEATGMVHCPFVSSSTHAYRHLPASSNVYKGVIVISIYALRASIAECNNKERNVAIALPNKRVSIELESPDRFRD